MKEICKTNCNKSKSRLNNLKVIVNDNFTPAKPQTLYEISGENFLHGLYSFLTEINGVSDGRSFIGFLKANRETIRMLAYANIECPPYLKVLKGGASK